MIGSGSQVPPHRTDGWWICVDGVDGTGKSTVAPQLARWLGATTATEFSAGSLGQALLAAVMITPNYIMRSRIGQSLHFLGDFFEVYETQIQPVLAGGDTVVSDRGWLSKYAYQFVTLAEQAGPRRARAVLDSVLGLLPPPDLTIYLDVPPDVLRERIRRRDGLCTDHRVRFNAESAQVARDVMRRGILPSHVVLDANRPVATVLADAQAACARLFKISDDDTPH